MRATIASVVAVLLLALGAAAGPRAAHSQLDLEPSRSGTLWIFDADFEDMGQPDNQGWVTEDLSGTLGHINHWHKDTIRINGFAHLGSRTWWCGTVNECWVQPRGYGNSWVDCLSRGLSLSEWSSPGDAVALEFDQRFALEHDYDYAYVDVREEPEGAWVTKAWYCNPGPKGTMGWPQDWDSSFGHQALTLSSSAGSDITLRFRVDSDILVSNQDTEDYLGSIADGAWQIDNIRITVNDIEVWYDNCESPDDNGWVHDDIPATGQTGVIFGRLYDPPTHRGRNLGWVMGAVEGTSGRMVDGQYSTLVSPAIDMESAEALVVRWDGWLDLPEGTGDYHGLSFESRDDPDCLGQSWGTHAHVDWENGGPSEVHEIVDATVFTGHPWFGLRFFLSNRNDPDPGAEHMAGIFVDRVRVGVPFTTGVPDVPEAALHLERIAPNPCAGEAAVAFSLGAPSRVTVRVYDLAGRVVCTAADRAFDAGPCAVTWDGTDDAGRRVGSGVYLVKVSIPEAETAGKVVLLR